MAEKKTCPDCGAVLPADAPQGFCAQCLMAAGANEATQLGATHTSSRAEERPGRAVEPEVRPAQHSFGDYELLEEIARGGMGVVYKARQLSLDRIVAVKMILAGAAASREFIHRFRTEAAAAANLQHPNIVAVHEVGAHQGENFLVMDFVDGPNLSHFVGQQPLPAQRAARYVKLIAEAIHYAHERGILHRDLKPSNVLIDSVTDQPRVTDFGLAKRLDGESSLTVTGQVLGSPNFMPPEQASGSRGKVGRHSDVYGLGAILYHLLTARAPFQAESLEAIVTQVLNTEPVPPRLANPTIPRDLETICLKCLEKEPGRRYVSAAALGAELERWLRGEPIQARPTTAWQRAVKWTRRKPAIAALVAAVLAVGMAGLAGVLWQWRKANAQREEAEANLYAADMILAGLALQDNDLGKARTHLARHEPHPGSEDLRAWEWRYIRGQCLSDELFTLEGHAPSLSVNVAFLSTNLLTSGSSDGTIRLWDLGSRREVRALHHGSPLQKFRVSPDGRLLVANDENAKKMFVWDRETFGLVYSTRSATDSGGRADFLADGRTLFFYQSRTNIARLTLGPGEPREEFWMQSTPQSSLACSPDGKLVAVTGNGFVEIRSLKSDSAISVYHPDGPSVLVGARVSCFSPDSQYLALQHGKTVHLVDAKTGRWLRSHDHHQRNVSGVAFSPDGRLVITAGHDQAVWFQDIDTWSAVARYRGHLDQIVSVAVSPDGRLLATGAKDGSIKIWDARPPVQKDALQEVLSRASRVHFSHDSKQLVTVDRTDGGSEIQVWNTATASMTDRFAVEGNRILDAMLLTSQKKIALVAEDERVEIWDLASHRRNALLVPASDKPPVDWALTFAARWLFEVEDGHTLICVQGIHGVGTFTALEKRGPLSVHICDLATMKPLRSWRFPFGFGVTAGNFSPDGKLFAIGGHDGELVVFNLEDGRTLKTIRAHGYAIMKIEFLTRRPLMATAGMDGYLQLWDTDTWERRHRLRADPNELYSAAFHPDGTRVVTGAQGSTPLILWDVPGGRELSRLQSPFANKVNRLLFIDHDTLVGWVGQQLPGLNDKVVTWKAPSFAEINAAESLNAVRVDKIE
jgi:WD40 repeat protein